jgi:hypothetical protein
MDGNQKKKGVTMWTADDDEPDEPEKDELDEIGGFVMEDPHEGEEDEEPYDP